MNGPCHIAADSTTIRFSTQRSSFRLLAGSLANTRSSKIIRIPVVRTDDGGQPARARRGQHCRSVASRPAERVRGSRHPLTDPSRSDRIDHARSGRSRNARWSERQRRAPVFVDLDGNWQSHTVRASTC
jgi:hypothetical protein